MVVRLRGPEIELEVQEESVQGTTGSRSTELIKWRCWTKSCRASGELRLIKAKFWPPAPSKSKEGPSISNNNKHTLVKGRNKWRPRRHSLAVQIKQECKLSKEERREMRHRRVQIGNLLFKDVTNTILSSSYCEGRPLVHCCSVINWRNAAKSTFSRI